MDKESKKTELINKLQELEYDEDIEYSRIQASQLLLEYINDEEISEACNFIIS